MNRSIPKIATIHLFALACISLPVMAARSNPRAAYPMEAFRQVDPKLISHREAVPITVPVSKPSAIACSGTNAIVVAGENEIAVIDETGTAKYSTTIERGATCVAVAPDGSILLGMKNSIRRFSPDLTSYEDGTSLGEDAHLTGIAVGSNSFFACDSGQRKLWRYKLTGALIAILDAPDNQPSKRFIIPSPGFDAVPMHNNAGFWVVNPGQRKIMQLNEKGGWISEWGRSAPDTTGFCGCCNPTHIALLANGNIVTSEKHIPRVKIYSPTGVLISVVAKPDDFPGDIPPSDIAVDHNDRVLLLDTRNQRIRVFTRK